MMDKEKWMIFVNSYFGMITYRGLVKLYQQHPLEGEFFYLNRLACQNELLMRIAAVVKLCQEMAKYDVGSDALKALEELKAIYAKGYEGGDRSSVNFLDCGVLPYRDKVVAQA